MGSDTGGAGSRTEQLRDGLSQVGTRFDDAVASLESARRAAEEALEHFGMLGGSADRAQSVIDLIEDLHREATGLDGRTDEIGTALDAVDHAITPEENIAELDGATERVDSCREALRAVVDACDAAIDQTHEDLAGSARADDIAGRIEEARDDLDRGRTALDGLAAGIVGQQEAFRGSHHERGGYLRRFPVLEAQPRLPGRRRRLNWLTSISRLRIHVRTRPAEDTDMRGTAIRRPIRNRRSASARASPLTGCRQRRAAPHDSAARRRSWTPWRGPGRDSPPTCARARWNITSTGRTGRSAMSTRSTANRATTRSPSRPVIRAVSARWRTCPEGSGVQEPLTTRMRPGTEFRSGVAGPFKKARVVFEYVPSAHEWRVLTYYPEA